MNVAKPASATGGEIKPGFTQPEARARATAKSAPILFFSTDAIEPSLRFDFWFEAVGRALLPMVVISKAPKDFRSSLAAATLGDLQIIHATGSAQESARTRQCLAADIEYSFNLLVDFGSAWTFTWRGRRIGIRPGDMIFTDSRYLHSGSYPDNCSVTNIKLPPAWTLTWLRQPDRFAGTLIAGDVGWGRALSAFIAQMTPRLALESPLPHRLIADNVGSLLSLIEAEMLGKQRGLTSGERQTVENVKEVIRQRATEIGLTAADVSAALRIQEATLHRCLESAGETFASLLMMHRILLARRMLEARQFRLVTTAEIGRRAGFSDPSYFVRVATRYLGTTPAKFRHEIIR